jgi:hypothetical protein
MIPVQQVSIYFLTSFGEVIRIEVMNLMKPEDQKMKHIDMMYEGVTMFLRTIYYSGYVWLPYGLLCVAVVCVKHSVDIYRRRRRSRLLPLSTGHVA